MGERGVCPRRRGGGERMEWGKRSGGRSGWVGGKALSVVSPSLGFQRWGRKVKDGRFGAGGGRRGLTRQGADGKGSHWLMGRGVTGHPQMGRGVSDGKGSH